MPYKFNCLYQYCAMIFVQMAQHILVCSGGCKVSFANIFSVREKMEERERDKNEQVDRHTLEKSTAVKKKGGNSTGHGKVFWCPVIHVPLTCIFHFLSLRKTPLYIQRN